MIDNILKKEYEDLLKKPREVFTIFSDFYGEDKTDLQGIPTLEEVLEESCQIRNIFDYLNNRIRISISLLEKYSLLVESGVTDFSFKNPLIIENFYKDYILYHIDKGLFSKINIMVYFPHITVTNENGKSIDIKKMFVKVPVTVRGLFKGGGMKFNRSEYTVAQLRSCYMHSHVNSISYDSLSHFKSSCLGDGPIRDTIILLNDTFDRDRWFLLCLELSKYIEVESLAGGPYMRLENVTNSSVNVTIKGFDSRRTIPNIVRRRYSDRIVSFVKYLVDNNKIPVNYFNGSYGVAMSFIDFNVFISNEFIDWWNNHYDLDVERENSDRLLRESVLNKCIVSTDKIIIKGSVDRNLQSMIERAESQIACTFKGQQIPVVITQNPGFEHDILLLNPAVTESILSKILAIININYGTRTSHTDPTTGSQRTSYMVQGNSKTILINN